MNIHITDIELVEKLKKATIAKVVVGSHMYGTNNKNSDVDYLYIYATSENELLSPINTHHQLQYKEDGVDYNFVSLHTFIENILNGDSTINYEVIHSTGLIGTDLTFLHSLRNSFTTYTIIRSYLGFCRRDIKHFHKASSEYDKKKRLGHIIRGYIYARQMLNYIFDFDDCNKVLRSIEIDVTTNKQLREYEKLVSELRKELNERLNNKTLLYAQKMYVSDGIKLSESIINYCKSDNFKTKQNILKDFDLTYFVDSFENWVKY